MSIRTLPKINEVFPTIKTFASLSPIAEKAEAKLSFWGYRYVDVRGFDGSLSLDALPARLLEMREQNFSLSGSELDHGRLIEKRINLILKKSDELVNEKNYFTQFLTYARDFFSAFFTSCCMCTDSTWDKWEGELGGNVTHFRQKFSDSDIETVTN